MVVLDNLVVSIALPSIRRDLGASIQTLEWTVNAYVLAYAVLLLPGAALADRFGRKRMFIAGIALFTVSSAAAALAPTVGLLIAARATQGMGAAIVTPLTLTLLADFFFNDTATTEIYTLSLHDALPISLVKHYTYTVGHATRPLLQYPNLTTDRKSTRLNSSHVRISYAVFCLKKKN